MINVNDLKCFPIKSLANWIHSLISFRVLVSVQSLSRVRLFTTPWIAARQASPSITNSWSSLRLTFIELVMPSSHLIFCYPLLLLPPVPPSIRVFSNEPTLCMRRPKYWSFGVKPCNSMFSQLEFCSLHFHFLQRITADFVFCGWVQGLRDVQKKR